MNKAHTFIYLSGHFTSFYIFKFTGVDDFRCSFWCPSISRWLQHTDLRKFGQAFMQRSNVSVNAKTSKLFIDLLIHHRLLLFPSLLIHILYRLEKLPSINAEMNKKFQKFVQQCLVSECLKWEKIKSIPIEIAIIKFIFIAALRKWGANGTCEVWQIITRSED